MSAGNPRGQDIDSRKDRPPKAGFLQSFSFAFRGIAHAARGRNFIVQACIGLFAIVLGFVFGITPVEWIALIMCCGVVLAGECFNSALEDAIDLACPNYNKLAGRAKDMAAGAVLIASIASLIVGLIIFAPRCIDVIFTY